MILPSDSTSLSATFASSTIQILREEEAYSFLNLVADCGGVLGLFIGFNFLMIWDWTFIALTRFLHVKNHHHQTSPEKTSLQSRHPTFHTSPASDATLSNLGKNLLFIISMKAKNEFYFWAENKKALMMPEEGEIWS